mgnify:FL=1
MSNYSLIFEKLTLNQEHSASLLMILCMPFLIIHLLVQLFADQNQHATLQKTINK